MTFVRFRESTREEKSRALANTLAAMSNILWSLQHNPDSWDNRIKAIQEIAKLCPLVIRGFIYLKNTDEKTPQPPSL